MKEVSTLLSQVQKVVVKSNFFHADIPASIIPGERFESYLKSQVLNEIQRGMMNISECDALVETNVSLCFKIIYRNGAIANTTLRLNRNDLESDLSDVLNVQNIIPSLDEPEECHGNYISQMTATNQTPKERLNSILSSLAMENKPELTGSEILFSKICPVIQWVNQTLALNEVVELPKKRTSFFAHKVSGEE